MRNKKEKIRIKVYLFVSQTLHLASKMFKQRQSNRTGLIQDARQESR